MTGIVHLLLLAALISVRCLPVLRNRAASVRIGASLRVKSFTTIRHQHRVFYRSHPSLSMLNFMDTFDTFDTNTDFGAMIMENAEKQLVRFVDMLRTQIPIPQPKNIAQAALTAEAPQNQDGDWMADELLCTNDMSDVGKLFDPLPISIPIPVPVTVIANADDSADPLNDDHTRAQLPQLQQGGGNRHDNGNSNNNDAEGVWVAIVDELRTSLSAVHTIHITERKQLLDIILNANEAYLAAVQSVQDQCIVNSYADHQTAADVVTVELSLMYAKAVKALAYKNRVLTQPPVFATVSTDQVSSSSVHEHQVSDGSQYGQSAQSSEQVASNIVSITDGEFAEQAVVGQESAIMQQEPHHLSSLSAPATVSTSTTTPPSPSLGAAAATSVHYQYKFREVPMRPVKQAYELSSSREYRALSQDYRSSIAGMSNSVSSADAPPQQLHNTGTHTSDATVDSITQSDAEIAPESMDMVYNESSEQPAQPHNQQREQTPQQQQRQVQQDRRAAVPPDHSNINTNSNSHNDPRDRRGKRLEREGDKYVYK